MFPYYCMFFVKVYPHTYRFYTHVAIYFFCSNNPDSEWFHTDNPLKGTQAYRMKALAEFLDDTHFRFPPQCCNSVAVEADSKFECSTSSPHCLPRCSVDIAQLYPEQTYRMRVVSSEIVAFTTTLPDQLQAMAAFVMPFIFPRLTIPKLLVPTDQTLSFLLRTSFGFWPLDCELRCKRFAPMSIHPLRCLFFQSWRCQLCCENLARRAKHDFKLLQTRTNLSG